MDRARRQKDMDTRPVGIDERLAGAVDVLGIAPRQPQMIGLRTSRAIACTDSKSPGEAIGKPASITSTPRSASACATWSFSLRFMLAPGDCSPIAEGRIEDDYAVVSHWRSGSRQKKMARDDCRPRAGWCVLFDSGAMTADPGRMLG